MKLIYNGFDFSTIGELFITQVREREGAPDQPTRAKVTLRVRVEIFQRSYDQNRSLLDTAAEALELPNAVLQWRNEAAGVDYVNQTATLTSDDRPEEWGEYHQTLNMVFVYYEQASNGVANQVPLVFTKAGGEALSLDVVNRWTHSAGVERFTNLRRHRKETRGKIRVEGQYYGDTTQPLDARRSALAALAAKFDTAMDGADGLLTYGQSGSVFQGVVQVEEWSCELDQLVNAINYSFTAGYTVYPDEQNYATVEMTSTEKDEFNGQLLLTVTGKIQSATEATARIKLAAVLAAAVAQRDYGKGQVLANDTTATEVDANADGRTFIELAFNASYRKWKSTNQKASFTKTGNLTAVPIGEVSRWRDHYAATRFNEARSQRRHATGSVDGAGTFYADMGLPLATRRTQLLAMQRKMKTEVNGAEGKLVYGDWTQVVRVDDFQAEVNQAETGIEWSLTASYSMFPNEGGYATVEFTVDQRDSIEEGDEFLTFAGVIQAPNGAAARAKLATLRTSVLKIYGWNVTQRLHNNTTLNAVDANGDATSTVAEGMEAPDKTVSSFIELKFSEDYRRRMTGTLISYTLQVMQREDIPTQTLLTTYAGTVTASGPNAGAAYATALAQAQALGADKEAVIDETAAFRGSTITQDYRQTQATNDREFMRLSFSYEYQSKLATGRAYIELTTASSVDTFGTDTETCSGFVAARDADTAEAIYLAQVRDLYDGRIIHTEQTGVSAQRYEKEGWLEQLVRYEFSMVMFKAKSTAVGVTFRYSFEVERDLLTLDMRTAVRGSCYGRNRPVMDSALNALLNSLNLGASARSRRSEDRERIGDGTEALLKLDFDEEYRGRVTGTAGALEFKLTESVSHSGVRWSVQDLPYDGDGKGGYSIPQPSGVAPGRRVITGSVTAGSEATARVWAKKQRALLTGDKSGNKFPEPEKWDTDFEFVPRIDGIARGTGANVQVCRVSFTFAEILPNYPAT